MEHIIASNIVKHLDINNIMNDLHHDFRERRSCETQQLSLVEDLAHKGSQGTQASLISLGFPKVFDEVNHSKLALKLHSYGISGPILRWIQAFLSNRLQSRCWGWPFRTCPCDIRSSTVPQGSVLGSILFLAHINDLSQDTVSPVRLFADDTAIYLTLDSRHNSLTWETWTDTGMGIKVGHGVQTLPSAKLYMWPLPELLSTLDVYFMARFWKRSLVQGTWG